MARGQPVATVNSLLALSERPELATESKAKGSGAGVKATKRGNEVLVNDAASQD